MAQVIFWNIFLVIFLWVVVNLTNTKQIQNIPHGDTILGSKEIGPKMGHLSCLCGKLEKTKEKYLDAKTAQRYFREAAKDGDILKKINNYPEIKEFADCLQCNFTFINCDEKGKCAKKTIKFSIEGSMNQTKVTESTKSVPVSNLNKIQNHVNKPMDSTADEMIPPGYVPKIIDIPIGGHKNHSRLPRFAGCSYPSAMETAAVSCRVYPNSIKCVQRCAFGHTLENGIRKEMQCKFKDNRWIPSGFKECVPFVDCSVTMTSGGSTTCTAESENEAPVCKIECLPYEDKSLVPMAPYECKIDGTWDPPLPFCVIPGSGMVLAPPPRVKLHNDQSDKEKGSNLE